MTSTDPPQDYVDDSEPERKRIRFQKSKRKTRQAQSNHPPGVQTRGFDGILAEATPAIVGNSVIGEESQSDLKPPPTPESSLAKSHHDTSASVQQRASSSGAQEESSEPSLMASVQRFAYRQVRAETEPANTHIERCRPGSVPQDVKAEKPSQKAKSLPDHDNITKLDVSRLVRCVSCESRWAIQKSASNKLSHLAACARKKGISPSTLKTLIVKENLKIQPTKPKEETKTPPDPTPAAPQTYMEAVVANAQPRKRQRRPDVTTGTLQPISQTKAAILDRAKALLGTMEIAPPDPPEPEAFGRSKLASEHIRMADTKPIASHLPGESALSSRLDLLRSMAGFPHS